MSGSDFPDQGRPYFLLELGGLDAGDESLRDESRRSVFVRTVGVVENRLRTTVDEIGLETAHHSVEAIFGRGLRAHTRDLGHGRGYNREVKRNPRPTLTRVCLTPPTTRVRKAPAKDLVGIRDGSPKVFARSTAP